MTKITHKEICAMKAKSEQLEKELLELNKQGQPLYITAVYDKKAELYQNIMTTPNKAYAVRGFMDAVRDENGQLFKYAEDFKLVCLGIMNQKNGKIYQTELETLVEASSVVVKK